MLQNHIVWAKSLSVGDETYGPFKPITSERFLNNTFEDIFHFTKSGHVPLHRRAIGVPFKWKSNIARFGHTEDRRCKGNIWFIPYAPVQSKAGKHNHPAIFPVALVEHAIKLSPPNTWRERTELLNAGLVYERDDDSVNTDEVALNFAYPHFGEFIVREHPLLTA